MYVTKQVVISCFLILPKYLQEIDPSIASKKKKELLGLHLCLEVEW